MCALTLTQHICQMCKTKLWDDSLRQIRARELSSDILPMNPGDYSATTELINSQPLFVCVCTRVCRVGDSEMALIYHVHN